MALSPDLIKRRKRREQHRAPLRPLREKVEGLEALSADEKLEVLLEEILEEAKKETLFTMTLEKMRLISALFYAGFVGTIFYNYEGQIAPGATVTTYLPVPAGWVFSPEASSYYSSLPWWLSVNIWIDTDLPALPIVALTRAPDRYDFEFKGLTAMERFMRFTVTNNHAANTANYLAIQKFTIMREAVWNMLEVIYLKPIAEYAQEKAEELTGRPFP